MRSILESPTAKSGMLPLDLSLRGILFLSVAVSTIERQCSREAAFSQA